MRTSRWLVCSAAVLLSSLGSQNTQSGSSGSGNGGHGNLAQAQVQAQQTSPRRYRQYWKKQNYPNPDFNARTCRSVKSFRFCDPDSVLTSFQVDQVEEALMPNHMVQLPCAKTSSNTIPPMTEVQFAVALAGQLDLTEYTEFHDRQASAAEDFARYVHNTWGVGVLPNNINGCENVQGSTGVLLFLSDADRAMYISRGQALATLLTNSRLDQVIDHMKPVLKQGDYVKAITLGINEINEWLELGEPGWNELVWNLVWDYAGFFWIALVFAFAYWQISANTKKKRNYAKVASQLSEIDRAKAEALQGQFRATSCPICLDEFVSEADGRVTLGSDGKPIKLLRCGHVFDDSCWQDWIKSGKGTVDKCPICQQDVGPGSDDKKKKNRPVRPVQPRVDQTQQYSRRDDNNDDLPPAGGLGGLGGPSSKSQTTTQGGGGGLLNTIGTLSSMFPRNTIPNANQQRQGPLSAAMLDRQRIEREMYQRSNLERHMNERNFRLLQLRNRFPDIVQPQHLERWTQQNYQGQMAQDEAFVANNPTRQNGPYGSGGFDGSGGSGSSFSHSGFGGGSSGGGRGGRW